MLKRFVLTLLILCPLIAAAAPLEPVILWPEGAPGAKGSEDKDIPQITPWIPAKQSTKAAVLVAPGGGYGHLASDHEGDQIAEWLNVNGIAAFVLRYRIAPDYGHPHPHMDAARAIRTIRSRAEEWGIDTDKIGMIGFSAGGHLTATTGTQFDAGDASSSDPVEKASSRPDFILLGYPVITMTDPHTHKGSRKNLLGENPTPEMIEKMSAEKNVNANTPPTFLFHTTEDQAVPVENPVLFYLACQDAGVPVEMHIYEKGRHGLGLAQGDPAFGLWPSQCITWLKVRGFIE